MENEDIKLSEEFNFNILEARFVSSRRGYLGAVPKHSSGSTYYPILKPYSGESGEQVLTWYRVAITWQQGEEYTYEFYPDLFKMILAHHTTSRGMVRFFDAFEGTMLSGIQLVGGKATQIWLRTGEFPSSFFFGLPTNDGQSPTRVVLQGRMGLIGNNNTYPEVSQFYTLWNK
ncbi:MAG: hypothetical protein LUG51_06625 [Tannerellaceae bacterium]|nr:hypothetical protein [Tannerellaceae bacterium]